MSTLTDQQTRSLKTRDVSVALAAGAGCGKTFVLTERFLSHLDPAGPDAPSPASLRELVAITFTDAAAREMRTRIRAKCYERLETAPTANEQDYWLRLLRTIDTAPVSTIHAFCTSLLRTHAVEAGLDPTFGVLDQTDADVLQAEAIDDVLRQKLDDRDERTLELAAAYGLAKLKNQLRELLHRRHEAESFEEFQNADPDELVAVWQACYDAEAHPTAVGEVADAAPIDEIISLLRFVEPTKDKFIEARAALLEVLPRLARGDVAEADLDAIHQFARVQRICTAADWPAADDFNRYKTACTKLRDAIKDGKLKPFDEAVARQAAVHGLSLLGLAHDVAAAYERRKESQGKLDFDDQLAGAYKLLTDPRHASIREQFASGLKLLLVDEFQDTDRLQVELVLSLCGEGFDAGRLFFVGDFKQSIYRFRGAQPDVFRDLRSKVPDSGRLPLTMNFRSQPAILHFVNALFCESFGDQYEPLRPHREQATPEPAVEFLWTITPDKSPAAKGTVEAARRQEARWIARRLRQLIDGGEPMIVDGRSADGGPRPLKLGDVAILFRALSDVQYYEEALREYDLDYYLVGGHAFYSQQEIFDVLNLLRAVASAADEISLAGVLRSPFFSLSDETLFWLVESAGSLNAALRSGSLPKQLSPEERAKTAAAAETIRYLRQRKDALPIAALVSEALTRTGYDAVLLAEFLGERKLANLYKLLERARAADHGGVLELDGFITQLAQFIAQEPKEALAATCPESADVIRLMTIHHAKGLEFPLVVVPDLDRSSGFRKPAAALDPVLGPLVPRPDDDGGTETTVGFDLYYALEKRADAEERTRLLYVACTRAADYLILSSSLTGYDQPKSDWMRLVARQFDLRSGDASSLLPDGYDRPLVLVTDEEPATDHRPSGKSRGPDLVKMLERTRQEVAAGRGVVPPEVCPVPVDHAARQQFSFSRLTGQLIRLDAPPILPHDDHSDDAHSRIDPRGLGSLVHAVLERVDLRADNPIGTWCEQLAEEHVVDNIEAAAESARGMVERFATSARWRELAKATAMHRELEFLLAWPPAEKGVRNLFPDASHEPTSAAAEEKKVPDTFFGRYLQGYIDCLYQDRQGDWHLIDYKTNNVTADACPQEARRYEMQLYVYAMAVERALGCEPVELVLHFLRPGVEHVVAWNDNARRRGVEMVNQAMQREQRSEVGGQGSELEPYPLTSDL
jgi:ATP-dependent helicase/nuclease subunit A